MKVYEGVVLLVGLHFCLGSDSILHIIYLAGTVIQSDVQRRSKAN